MHLLDKYFFSFLFFLVLGSPVSYGQGAKFSVNSTIGCNPFTVVVTDLSGVPIGTAINYDYGDGSDLDSIEFHTYSQPGIYRIIQTVANANPRQDTAYVEVINQYPPEFFLFNCKGTFGSVIVRDTLYEAFEIDWGDGNKDISPAYSLITHDYGLVSSFDVTVKGLINGLQSSMDSANLNCSSTTKRLAMIDDILPASLNQIQVLNTDPNSGSLTLDYTLIPGNNYLIEIKDQNQANYTILDTINQIINPNNYTIDNLNTRDNYYCISITAFDPCDGDILQSNIGCSVRLDVTPENQQNRIVWQTNSMDFLNYSVTKDGAQLSMITIQGQTQLIDNQVICGIDYEYHVRLNENTGFISISDINSVTAISTDIPDPIENISATISGQDVLLNWEEPTTYLAIGYIISRSTDGITYTVLDTVNAPTYVDQELFTQSTPYHYDISYYDACNNVSEKSIVTRPILLVSNYDKSLSWSDYLGWINGVREYILEKYDENGQLIASQSLGLATSYQEDLSVNPFQFVSYIIRAIPNTVIIGEVDSNILEVIYPSKVAFPNAFSPNGDGMNDIFNFESRFITAVIMKIYNRWGELVYQTENIDQGWDGNVGGKAAPPGAYIHHTQLTDDMGITFVKTGEIILIR